MTSWSALKRGIDVFTQRLPLMMGTWLIIFANQQVIDLVIPDVLWWVESLLSLVILTPLYAGQYWLALRVVRGEPATIRDLFDGFAKTLPLIGAGVLVSLLTGLAALAFVVPGIIVALVYAFTSIRFLDGASDRQVGIIQAMRESAAITQGYRATLFGIGLLLMLPYIVLTILVALSVFGPGTPPWIIQLVILFSGTLFLGPVQATSYMVVYDCALADSRFTRVASDESAEPAEAILDEPADSEDSTTPDTPAQDPLPESDPGPEESSS